MFSLRPSHTTTFFHNCNNFLDSLYMDKDFYKDFCRKIFVKIFVVCEGLYYNNSTIKLQVPVYMYIMYFVQLAT